MLDYIVLEEMIANSSFGAVLQYCRNASGYETTNELSHALRTEEIDWRQSDITLLEADLIEELNPDRIQALISLFSLPSPLDEAFEAKAYEHYFTRWEINLEFALAEYSLGNVFRACRMLALPGGATYEEMAEFSGIPIVSDWEIYEGEQAVPGTTAIRNIAQAVSLTPEYEHKIQELAAIRRFEVEEAFNIRRAQTSQYRAAVNDLSAGHHFLQQEYERCYDSGTFGNVLRYHRLSQGQTIEFTAEKLGINRRTLEKWELDRRRPAPEWLPLLADALNISPSARGPFEHKYDIQYRTPWQALLSTAQETYGALGLTVTVYRQLAPPDGITQDELAERASLTRPTIQHTEQGSYIPSTSEITRIGQALQLSRKDIHFLQNKRTEAIRFKQDSQNALLEELLEVAYERDTFGRTLSLHRQLAGFTQQQVALQLNVIPNTVLNWENDYTPIADQDLDALKKIYKLTAIEAQRLEDKRWENHTQEWSRILEESIQFKAPFSAVFEAIRHLSQSKQFLPFHALSKQTGIISPRLSAFSTDKGIPTRSEYKTLLAALDIPNHYRTPLLQYYVQAHADFWNNQIQTASKEQNIAQALRYCRAYSEPDNLDKIAKSIGVTTTNIHAWESNASLPTEEQLLDYLRALNINRHLHYPIRDALRASYQDRQDNVSAVLEADNITLGQALQVHFEAQGLTSLRAIARSTSFGRNSLKGWMNDEMIPSVDHLGQLADHLQLDPQGRNQLFTIRRQQILAEGAQQLDSATSRAEALSAIEYLLEMTHEEFALWIAENMHRIDQSGQIQPFSRTIISLWMNDHQPISDDVLQAALLNAGLGTHETRVLCERFGIGDPGHTAGYDTTR